jgi:protein-S-isoprenylcysteine O-methyltransferase Ste14
MATQTAISVPLLGVLLFAPAGTLRDWPAWLFGFVVVAGCAAIGLYFLKTDPALIRRRQRVGPAAEAEPTQKIIMSIVSLGSLLLIVLPGFDHRWQWSHVPAWLVLAANAAVALSFVAFFVVLKQNSYAASTVVVEPGQPVVSTGLYGIVRHPMYSAALLLLAATPLALGSSWTLLLTIVLIPALIWRLLDEERVLMRELPGYADYCRKVRWRLVPSVW